jgi:hypothetical protein
VHLFPTLHLVMSWYLEISHGGIYLRNCWTSFVCFREVDVKH